MDERQVETNPVQRARVWYACLLIIFAAFVVRLFYLEIIHYDHYKSLALSDQVREYDVLPERGVISAQLNGRTVPLVLNQALYTVFADPSIIKKPAETARAIAPLLNQDVSSVEEMLRTKKTKYVVLQRRVSPELNKKILALKHPGIASQQMNYRVYPQGTMAAQVLGFVNNDGEGKYGLEESLNTTLGGKKGRLKAITDVNGVPLAASSENLLIQPEAGERVVLTLDMGMQAQVENIVKSAQEKFRSKNVSAIVMETNTGAVKAMANYPTFDPANYQTVEDGTLFQNYSVATPIEPGSITKILTIAAGIDTGAITKNTSYYDPGKWTIDGAKVLNVAEGTGSGTKLDWIASGGKTGTAQKSRDGHGYTAGAYMSSFGGIVPIDDPRLVVLVVLDEPDWTHHYASQSAVPLYRGVIEDIRRCTDWLSDAPGDRTGPVVLPDPLQLVEVPDVLYLRATSSDDRRRGVPRSPRGSGRAPATGRSPGCRRSARRCRRAAGHRAVRPCPG